MRNQAVLSPEAIALKGSAAVVSDCFRYAIYSILFLRGVYAIEDFFVISKYDLELLVALNEDLEAYVAGVLDQVEQWLTKGLVSQLVLVIVSKEQKITLERWVFEVDVSGPNADSPAKAEADISREIHLVLAGIRGTNSMLREIDEPSLCNILVYKHEPQEELGNTNDSAPSQLPQDWEDIDPHAIPEDVVEEVKLKKFSTGIHVVQATVAYHET